MSVGEIVASVPKPVESTPSSSPRVRWGWIVGPRVDLPWFIGGALVAYLLFALHALSEADLFFVWIGWFALSNLPHFFGTYVRLYFDREERRQCARLAWGSLAVVFLGPLVIAGCLGLYQLGGAFNTWHRLPFDLFAVSAGLWAYWHMVRQHYGFLALYRRKNQDMASVDRWLDNTLLYVALLAPFLAFALRHPMTRYQLGLSEEIAADSWESLLILLTQSVLVMLIVLFVARQIVRWQRGEPINGPKMLLFLALIPLYALIGYHPATLTAPLLAFSAFVTVFHDIQYHAIVYNHQRNRCYRPGVDRGRFGLGALVTSSVWLYMGCALTMGVVGWMLSCKLEVYSGCTAWLESSAYPMFGRLTLRDLFLGVALGFAMHHYFVDQFIWRPSKSAELRRDLRLNNAG